MRKDVREFIRRLEAAGLTVEPTPGHYRVLRDGKPLRKANGMPFMLPFSPDTIRWRRAAIVELRKLGIDLWHHLRIAQSPHEPGQPVSVGRYRSTLEQLPTSEAGVEVESLAAQIQSDVQHCVGLPSSRRGRAEHHSAGGPSSCDSVFRGHPAGG